MPIPAGGKWEDQPFMVVVREAKAAARMARTTTLTRRTPVQRNPTVTNGRSVAVQPLRVLVALRDDLKVGQ